MVSVRIDPKTGRLANPATQNAIFEFFLADQVPTEQTEFIESGTTDIDSSVENRPADITEDIF